MNAETTKNSFIRIREREKEREIVKKGDFFSILNSQLFAILLSRRSASPADYKNLPKIFSNLRII